MARAEKVVVDASVAFKWFVEERDSAAAVSIVEDYDRGLIDVSSVELMPFETLNALRYAPDTGLEDLKTAAVALEKLGLDLRPLKNDLALRSVENALKYGISLYDSSYLSLGELEAAPVYTADEKLIRRVGGSVLRHVASYTTL